MNDLFPQAEQSAPLELASISTTLAISLTQPWATLMEINAKLNETRGWRTSYRGWIGIQAAKGFPVACRDLCEEEPFATVLHAAGIRSWKDLPRGALLGLTKIVDCRRTENVRGVIGAQELAFGDYSDQRFAFITTGFRRLREPLPMRGALSIWQMPRPITEADLA